MAHKYRTQVTHEGETIDVDVELMGPKEAGIKITDEMRARAKRIADDSHAHEENARLEP